MIFAALPSRRRLLQHSLAAMLLGGAALASHAQPVTDSAIAVGPSKPVRVVVPFSPGGAADIVAVSLAAKSVTNPIALDITLSLNGIPAITAVGVIFAGLTGQILGFKLLEVLGIKTMSAQGLALGSASHALGINAAWQRGPEYAAYATLGLILNGILSAIIAPYLIPWLFA